VNKEENGGKSALVSARLFQSAWSVSSTDPSDLLFITCALPPASSLRSNLYSKVAKADW
jgi:hypothetical protein